MIPGYGHTEDDDKLQTVTAKGDPVAERVPNIQTARKIYEQFKRAMGGVNLRRARLKGLIDGNPPYDPTAMAEMNLKYVTNINFLEARSILEQKAATSFDLLFEVPTYIEVTPLAIDPTKPDPGWGTILAEEFTTMLQNWPGFFFAMNKVRHETDAYGLGTLIWRDEYDWRFKAYNTSCFLPDPMAELDIDTLGIFFLRDRMSAGELYRAALSHEDAAKKAGWNARAVRRLLAMLYVENGSASASIDKYQTSQAESAQQDIRNTQSFLPEQEFQSVKLVHLCVKEVETDKVSHYIFAEDELTSDPGKTDNTSPDDFLFRYTERFDQVSNVLWWLPYNLGDGYVLSVRGLGSDIEATCDLSNRFLGRTVDAGFTTASLLLQPDNEASVGKMQLVRMGMMTVIPPGLNLQQSSFQPNINPLINLRDLLGSVMKNNTGVWKPNGENFSVNEGQPRSAREVAEQSSKEARLEKSNIVQDYVHYERLYREIFRRVTRKDYIRGKFKYPGQESARRFVDNCVARGVPEELIFAKDFWNVKVTQAIGMGSQGVRLDLTQQILNVRGILDEVGQRNALRDYIAARVGQRNVDRYASQTNRNAVPSNETGIATLENNDFAEGSEVPVGNDQIHFLHIQTHLLPIQEVVKAVLESRGQGINIERATKILARGLVHVEAHLQYLAQDPERKQMVQEVLVVIKQAATVFAFLQKQGAAQQKEQADAEEMQKEGQMQDPEMQLKQHEIELKAQLHQLDIQGQNAARMTKAQTAAQLKQQIALNDMQLKAQRQAAELDMDSRKLDATNALKAAKAGTGV